MIRPRFRTLTAGQLAVDITVGALFVPVFAFGILDPPLFGTVPIGGLYPVLGALVVVVFGTALAFRRLSPELSLAIAWVGAIAQMVTSLGPQPFDVAIFGVLYATAAYGTRVVMWTGLASAGAGAVVATGYVLVAQALESPATFADTLFVPGGGVDLLVVGAMWFLTVAFALLLSWTIGALVRSSRIARANRRAREWAERDAAAEQERGRIARDMHDVVAHSLAVIVSQADGARYLAARDPATAQEALETIGSTARSALTDVRLLLGQLRHRQAEGPQPTLADLEGLFSQVRQAGVALRIDVDPAPPGQPPAGVQLAVYRILQEALTNALRHGGGAGVDVRMAWAADRVELEVRNAVAERHGRPAGEQAGGPEGRGHGIVGMTERAQLVGGTLRAGASGGAFVVRADLPVAGYASSPDPDAATEHPS